MKIIILIDNGHGWDTSGKLSPDGRLREYAYTREIARMLCEKLRLYGYDARCIVTEEKDISLAERCRRVNCVCDTVGKKNVIFISVHVDAAGSGKWMNAGGWSAYTTRGKTDADVLAECLYDAAKIHLKDYAKLMDEGKKSGVYSMKQKPYRTDMLDGDSDKEANFYVLAHTSCPAVLTENLFQDNRSDVDFLLSPVGKKTIVDIHYDGIVRYLECIKKK